LRGTVFLPKLHPETNMTFVLPEIEKANCKLFTACARVVTKNKSQTKGSSVKDPFVAILKRGRSQRLVRLCIEGGGHLHLDVATPDYFPKDRKPKATHTWPQIEALLGRYVGQEIEVRTGAVFSVPLHKLPESGFIRLLSMESESRKVSMKLTGGTFSVSGAPIQRIIWSLERDGKGVEVKLRSSVRVTLKETYLDELFGLLSESLQVFVLNKHRSSQ
jgi:hypothetical protein